MSSPRLLDQVRDRIRVKHYSLRTQDSYLHWIRRFIFFHGKKHPRDMGGPQVEAFLSHLATAGRVASSTQNQALSALLFLYREVLQIDLPWMDGVVRAKRPKHLPVVLTESEIRALLAHLEGTRWLVVSLLYSSGARLLEGLRLRVKDVDFERHEITVRDGKGARDRVTMLPARLVEPLSSHLARVRVLHERDLAEGYGEVHMPFALARKYPKAGRSWIWQYVFPSGSRSVDPADGVVRRHHLDEKIVQRAVAGAARAAGLSKPVSPHVLRHYLPFLTMSSDPDERSGSFEESWSRSRHAQPITRHSFPYLQTVQEAKELVSRLKAPWRAVPWQCLRKGLLLHCERCVKIDLRGLH